jgi:hypothetical protein
VTSTGPDIPYGYMLRAEPAVPIIVLHTMGGFITGFAPGPHTIGLESVPSHCSVADNPRVVNISAGTMVRDTVHTDFQISCKAITGVVKVSVTTGGEDADPRGYTVRLDGGSPRSMPPNGTVQFNAVAEGQHSISLNGLATNCTLAGSNPRAAAVMVGGATYDTARVAFEIACAHTEKIAITRYDLFQAPQIVVVYTDGSNEYGTKFEGILGGFSPDGKKVLGIAVDCDDWYGYYYGCNYLGVRTVAIDKLPLLSVTQLTSTWEDASPTYTADGQRIAFIRRDGLFVMNADGTGQVAIVTPGEASNVKYARSPSWSADGTRIAFSCALKQVSWTDICVVNADGSNLTRVTTDAYEDVEPAWSPDGNRIAFATNRGTTDGVMHIATMSATGTDFVQLGLGSSPAWSRDGSRLLYVVMAPNGRGIYMMKADGTNVTRLTSGDDHGPKWRP